eukprot:scaffold46486_cov28-Tisochrysis_lutea.AAC.2
MGAMYRSWCLQILSTRAAATGEAGASSGPRVANVLQRNRAMVSDSGIGSSPSESTNSGISPWGFLAKYSVLFRPPRLMGDTMATSCGEMSLWAQRLGGALRRRERQEPTGAGRKNMRAVGRCAHGAARESVHAVRRLAIAVAPGDLLLRPRHRRRPSSSLSHIMRQRAPLLETGMS